MFDFRIFLSALNQILHIKKRCRVLIEQFIIRKCRTGQLTYRIHLLMLKFSSPARKQLQIKLCNIKKCKEPDCLFERFESFFHNDGGKQLLLSLIIVKRTLAEPFPFLQFFVHVQVVLFVKQLSFMNNPILSPFLFLKLVKLTQQPLRGLLHPIRNGVILIQ